MMRFFDITACLFTPPELKDSEVELLWNERIRYCTVDESEVDSIPIPYVFIGKSPPEDGRFTIIYLHASGQDMFSSLKCARLLGKMMKANVIIPEYRGYSLLKEMKPDVEMIKKDMRELVERLNSRGEVNMHTTVVFGRSIGSYFASYLSHCFELHSCIIFCGFWSVDKIVENKTIKLIGHMVKQRCDNSEYLRSVKCKVLILHGMKVRCAQQDDLTSHKDIVAMVDFLNNENINLIVMEKLEHNYYDEKRDLQQPVFEFYDAIFPLDSICDFNYLRSSKLETQE